MLSYLFSQQHAHVFTYSWENSSRSAIVVVWLARYTMYMYEGHTRQTKRGMVWFTSLVTYRQLYIQCMRTCLCACVIFTTYMYMYIVHVLLDLVQVLSRAYRLFVCYVYRFTHSPGCGFRVLTHSLSLVLGVFATQSLPTWWLLAVGSSWNR